MYILPNHISLSLWVLLIVFLAMGLIPTLLALIGEILTLGVVMITLIHLNNILII